MQLGEFVERLGAPIEEVLDAYCAIQVTHPSSYDYLNPGCSEAELRAVVEQSHPRTRGEGDGTDRQQRGPHPRL